MWVCLLAGGSHVDTSKRICNSFDGYLIPFYESVFSMLKFRIPFNEFKEWVLNHLQIAPSQLHLVAWAFIKMFQSWCESREKEHSLNIYFNIFTVTRTFTTWNQAQGFILFLLSVNVFDVNLESWKNFKDPYFLMTL